MRPIKSLEALTLGILIAACGDPASGGPPGSGSPGGGPRDVKPIPGGGTSGGPIVDALTVFVQDEDGAPVRGAIVIVDSEAGSDRAGTDAAGRADFIGERFESAFATHVVHQSFRYASLVGARASVQTIVLEEKASQPAAAPRFAVTTGTVTGWDLLPINTEARARLAVVQAIGDGALADPAQRTRPGTVMPDNPEGTDHNILVNGYGLFPSWNDYALRYDTRAAGLAVYGGTWSPEAEPSIELTHLGFSMGMDRGELEIRHRLDQKVDLVVAGAPQLDDQELFLGLSVAERAAVIGLPLDAEGDGAMAPSLAGELASASYVASVHLTSEATVGGRYEREVLAERSGSETVFTIDRLLAPPANPTSAARSFAAIPADGATRHVFTLIDESLEQEVWSITVFGDDTRSVTLPEVPETMNDPLAEGSLLLEIRAEDLGDVDLDRARFVELPAPRSIAVSRTSVRL